MYTSQCWFKQKENLPKVEDTLSSPKPQEGQKEYFDLVCGFEPPSYVTMYDQFCSDMPQALRESIAI